MVHLTLKFKSLQLTALYILTQILLNRQGWQGIGRACPYHTAYALTTLPAQIMLCQHSPCLPTQPMPCLCLAYNAYTVYAAYAQPISNYHFNSSQLEFLSLFISRLWPKKQHRIQLGIVTSRLPYHILELFNSKHRPAFENIFVSS